MCVDTTLLILIGLTACSSSSGEDGGGTDNPCLDLNSLAPIECQNNQSFADIADLSVVSDAVIRSSVQAVVAANDLLFADTGKLTKEDFLKLRDRSDLTLRRLASFSLAAADLTDQSSSLALTNSESYSELLNKYRGDIKAIINDPGIRNPLGTVMRDINVSAEKANRLIQAMANELIQEEELAADKQVSRMALKAQRQVEIAAAASSLTVSVVGGFVFSIGGLATATLPKAAAVYVSVIGGIFDSSIKLTLGATKLNAEMSLPLADVQSTTHTFENTVAYKTIDNGSLILGLASNVDDLVSKTIEGKRKVLAGIQTIGGLVSAADKVSGYLQENPGELSDIKQLAETEITEIADHVNGKLGGLYPVSSGSYEYYDTNEAIQSLIVPSKAGVLEEIFQKLPAAYKLDIHGGELNEQNVNTAPQLFYSTKVNTPVAEAPKEEEEEEEPRPEEVTSCYTSKKLNGVGDVCYETKAFASGCTGDNGTLSKSPCPSGYVGKCSRMLGEEKFIEVYYGDWVKQVDSLKEKCAGQSGVWSN